MSQQIEDIRAAYLHLEGFRRPDLPTGFVPARKGIQPAILVGLGGINVPAATLRRGTLEVFGAAVAAGFTPPNRYSSHKTPISEDWEIVAYTVHLLQARGAIGELNGGLQIRREDQTLGDQQMFGWAADDHGQNAWYDATRTIDLPHPVPIPMNAMLIFDWVVNNITLGAADFDVQLDLHWRYWNP